MKEFIPFTFPYGEGLRVMGYENSRFKMQNEKIIFVIKRST